MISGYKSTLYSESLKNWSTYSFQAACHHGVATEYVWMNYPAPKALHDYSYMGDTFRDRERIKLRSERWLRRLKAIPLLERQALLTAINNLNRTKTETTYES